MCLILTKTWGYDDEEIVSAKELSQAESRSEFIFECFEEKAEFQPQCLDTHLYKKNKDVIALKKRLRDMVLQIYEKIESRKSRTNKQVAVCKKRTKKRIAV